MLELQGLHVPRLRLWKVSQGMREFFEAIEGCNPNRENRTFTVIQGEGYGERAVLSGEVPVYLSRADGFLAAHIERLTELRETGVFDVAGSSVYTERIGTEKKLVVCGAGHVSMPVIRLAKTIGCHVTVIDDRPSFADNGREAGADRVICDAFDSALAQVSGDGDTYFVIVTRGHQYDSECLRMILKKPSAYVGMMGSSRRVRIVKETLIKEGYDQEAVMGVHSPIGLPIQAETPEEIAVSILAEIIQVKNQKKNTEFPQEILRDLLGTAHTQPLPGRKVLCTIVAKRGAAPREVGAKMLYTSEGRSLGTIGGGCTEASVMEIARAMFQEDASDPVLLHMDLTADEAAREGEVCGGVIDVWVERVN